MLFHARARSTPSSDPTRAAERLRMVEQQIRSRDIHHVVVLEAMREVLRHEFVPASCQAAAYDDRPLSIGHGQTISQPYMVAAMTAALDPQPADSVLEIGTGSGYQTAVLARLARDILSFEWVPELADKARATLKRLGATNVKILTGDGSLARPDQRFDGILVTAGAPAVPSTLRERLAEGGRLVAPLGTRMYQELTLIRRVGEHFEEDRVGGCVFVPLRGPYGWR